MFFFKNHAENEVGKLVQDQILFFFNKFYMRQKQVVCSLVLIYFDSPQLGIQGKLHKILD